MIRKATKDDIGRVVEIYEDVHTMEELGENFGFLHYSTRIDGPLYSEAVTGFPEHLRLIDVNDFAQVWLDGKYLGSRWRSEGTDNPFDLPEIPPEGSRLDLLVENCGRINYGPRIGKDFKGIFGGVALEMQFRLGWNYDMLPMSDLSRLNFRSFADSPASFHRGFFHLEDTGDTFLVRPGVKGLAWINGFNLGRYWNKGPTETLYVPAPVLKKGQNEMIVLELEKLDAPEVTFSPEPRLGSTEPKGRKAPEN